MSVEDSRWSEIYNNYREYTDQYGENGSIAIGAGDLPLQSGALGSDNRNVTITENQTVGLNNRFLLESSDINPDISSLGYTELAYLPIGLTELLKVQITKDHKTYWKLTADIVNGVEANSLSIPDELLEQFELMVSLVLGRSLPQAQSFKRWSGEWVNNEILWNSGILASYLGFPVLEGFLKSICDEYVSMNGIVKEGKRVETFSGTRTEGDGCYNVGHLLYHTENVVADQSLADRMEMMRERVADFYNPDWSDSYNWSKDEVLGKNGLTGLRNSWLHGQKEADAENGILLNYLCLLLWYEINSKM